MNTRPFARLAACVLLASAAGPLLAQPVQAPAAPAQPQGPQAPLLPIQRVYTPGSFDSIDLSGSAVVRFTQGASDQVVIDGDDDVQRSVRLDLQGGTLSIRPGGAWKFWSGQRVQMVITARDLKRLSISGAADFVAPAPVQVGDLAVHISGAGLARFDQFRADTLKFSVSGSGDGQFAGSTRELGLAISGRGDFRGDALQTQRAKVSISGIGSAKLWVLNDLGVSVSGIGKVDYWGTPEVSRRSSGMATITGHGARPAP